MIAAVGSVAVVTVLFLIGVWSVFVAIFTIVGFSGAALLASAITTAVLLAIGYLEYSQLGRIEALADAQPVDRETAPELYGLTTTVAAMLGVPVPTIAVSDRDAPEAMAVGLRPGNIHLVLSTGTISALDGDELEAVIAHELAHVKNRDAMVMTALSLPVVLADGLRSRIDRLEDPQGFAILTVPLSLVSSAVWVLGRAITARLSRSRERAADRAAAAVIGSPSTLASALQTLDSRITNTPDQDLRAASEISSLSILSLEPRELEKVMLGPEGTVEPSYWWLRRRLHRLERWLFVSHPPTEDRLTALSTLEAEQETARRQNTND
jgi:heat shock protein HtpX